MDDYDTQHLNDHISNSSKRLGLKVVPKLSIENKSYPNARTNFYRICITRSILELLTKEEQYAVIDHELGHIKNKFLDAPLLIYILLPFLPFIMYALNLTFHSALFSPIEMVLSFLLFGLFRFPFNQEIIDAKKKSEFAADKVSAKLGNKHTLQSALLKVGSQLEMNKMPKDRYYYFTFTVFKLYFSKLDPYPTIEDRVEKLESY
jgi:Zn-dependent protease with chaperone function